jgi:hypothetical protein
MTVEINPIITDAGWDTLVKFFTGIITDGNISYFKLGEGGWSQSDVWLNTVATGDGGADYSGSLNFLPVIRTTLCFTAGAQLAIDVPASPYDGTGTISGAGGTTGTINYKTGAWTITWGSAVTLATPITASYRYHGVKSVPKSHSVGTGDGTIGPYFTVLTYWAPDAPIAGGTVTVSDGHPTTPQVLTDTPNNPYDDEGTLSGDGSGEINYASGEVSFTFTSAVPATQNIAITYKYDGAPDVPSSTAITDLVSEGDSSLYTFQKDFSSSDTWIVENHLGRLRIKVFLDGHEGLDDGNGYSPFYFEGGLFSEDDTMIVYFTFTKARKTGSSEITLYLDQVL